MSLGELEMYFHEEERNDSLFIYIGLDKKSFESLYNEYKDNNLGELYYNDGPIDGFYSEWVQICLILYLFLPTTIDIK